MSISSSGFSRSRSRPAALFGGWCWWRAQPSRMVLALAARGAVAVMVQAALGGVLRLSGHKPPSLHVLYGRAAAARVVRRRAAADRLGADGARLARFESAEEVGELPPDEQRGVVMAILQREIGVMALAALVIVVLLARAAATAG